MKEKMEKKFIEKYPELDGTFYDGNESEVVLSRKRVEEILDKYFTRVNWMIKGDIIYADKRFISEKKVKDAIDKWKRFTSTLKNYGIIESYIDSGEEYMVPVETLKRELGLE